MSRGDYKRLVVKPTLARQRIQQILTDEVPVRAEQVHAAHILVATQDAANEVVSRLNSGEDFATIAREVSTDTSTAGTGGDLGWFPRGVMVDPFEQAAFSLEPGQTSEPVQSSFGWHIIRVIEKEQDRPVALATLRQLQGSVLQDWLIEQRGESDIDADIALPLLDQDTTAPDTFQAPPEAPVPPTPTVVPTPTVAIEGSPTSAGDETPAATSTP
jgi:parvulin-like peptidyl-prolyl isomerase